MIKIGNIQLPDFPLLLAPMEDVSDPPFRRLCKLHGADLMYSEFISSEGLIRDAIKSRKKLDIFDYERPVGIQIFGGDEEAMSLSAKIVETVEPDLVDINFGCPVKKVVAKGAGAGVLKDIDLMVRLTKAVVSSTHLPVTVKTRLGWDSSSINIDEVAERLQEAGIKALTIHARTRSQMYKGEESFWHASHGSQQVDFAQRGVQGNIEFARINIVEGVHIHVKVGRKRRFGGTQFKVRQHNTCGIEGNMPTKMIYAHTTFLLKGAYT